MLFNKPCRFMKFSLAALTTVLLTTVSAAAAPRSFDCRLHQVEIMVDKNFDSSAESRSIALTFDDESHTITIYQNGIAQELSHVTITQIAMNGYTDNTSIGMQISSGDIVLQSYAPNLLKAEFGACQPSAKRTP